MSVRSTPPIIVVACLVVAALATSCSSEGDTSDDEGAAPVQTAEQALDDRVKSLLVAGQQAFQQGEHQRALAYLDSAETRAPEAPVISFNRARVYTALNQIDAARKAYRDAIALDPAYPEVRLRLGDLELQQGRLRKGLALYREEEDIEPTSPLYAKMAEAYKQLGAADSARMAYEKAVSLDSTNAHAHMMYGQFLEETGDLESALRHSRRALALQPDHSNYQFAVGSQLYQLGRLEESVEHLQRAADGRLLHYPAQYNLGQVFTRLGRTEEADHYLARADSARQLMDQITAAQRAASRNPNEVDNWTRLAKLFRSAGERNQAVQAYNMAATIQPRNLSVQNSMAEMMLAEGQTQEAIRRFEAILNADRSRTDTWISLGLAYAVAGNCAKARRAWETALEHRPGDATAAEYLSGLCQYNAP